MASGRSGSDGLKVSISTNNGRTFAPIHSAKPGKRTEATVDLKDKIFRRYAYWLRIELEGDAGLDSIRSRKRFSARPADDAVAGQGEEHDHGRGGPRRGDRDAVDCVPDHRDAAFNKNETTGTMGVVFDNVDVRGDACWWKGGTGTMTVPVEVPGDMVSLGFSTQFRARSEKDRIRVTASTDNGRSWREVAVLRGPTQGRTEHVRVDKWPARDSQSAAAFRDDRRQYSRCCRAFGSTRTTATQWRSGHYVRFESCIGGKKVGANRRTPRTSLACRRSTRFKPVRRPRWCRSVMRWGIARDDLSHGIRLSHHEHLQRERSPAKRLRGRSARSGQVPHPSPLPSGEGEDMSIIRIGKTNSLFTETVCACYGLSGRISTLRNSIGWLSD